MFASLIQVISGEPDTLTGFVTSELKNFETGAVIAAVTVIIQSITVMEKAGYYLVNTFQFVE